MKHYVSGGNRDTITKAKKVLSQGMHIWNVRTLSPTIQKLSARLKFGFRDIKFWVKLQGQGKKVKYHDIKWKALSWGIYIENIIWKPYLK